MVAALVLPLALAAHPGGLPGVLSVTSSDARVDIAWSAPPDDVAVIQRVAGRSADEVGRYLLEHVQVIQDGIACRGSVEIDEPPERAQLHYDCPRTVDTITVRADILLDVNPAYQTLCIAPVVAGPDRVLFTGSTTERSFALAEPTGAVPLLSPTPTSGPGEPRRARGFLALEERLLRAVEGASGVVASIAALGLALVVGAAHALAPGHGKSIAAAYLVGERGRRRDAAYVGVAVAGMHTVSVAVLGLVAYATARSVGMARAERWLALVAGLLVLAVGAWLTRRRLTEWRTRTTPHVHGPDEPPHTHDGDASDATRLGHGHDHVHELPEDVPPLSARGLAAIAASGGLLPSPSALVALLAAVAAGNVLFGLALVGAFSVGLAAAITAFGFAALWGRDVLRGRFDQRGRLTRALPLVGALAVLAGGLYLTVRALLRLPL